MYTLPGLIDLQDALKGSGRNAGLRYLNSRVDHRFTAVYKPEAGVMRNVAIVDKLAEVVPANLLAVPLEETFCQFVLRDGFETQLQGFDVAIKCRSVLRKSVK